MTTSLRHGLRLISLWLAWLLAIVSSAAGRAPSAAP